MVFPILPLRQLAGPVDNTVHNRQFRSIPRSLIDLNWSSNLWISQGCSVKSIYSGALQLCLYEQTIFFIERKKKSCFDSRRKNVLPDAQSIKRCWKHSMPYKRPDSDNETKNIP